MKFTELSAADIENGTYMHSTKDVETNPFELQYDDTKTPSTSAAVKRNLNKVSPFVNPPLIETVKESTTFSKYHKLWKTAFFKIKAKRAIEKLKVDVILYGTSFECSEIDEKIRTDPNALLKIRKLKTLNLKKLQEEDYFPCYLIHPESNYKRAWNLVCIVLLVYTAYIMPYRLAFQETVYWDGWSAFELCIDFLFFIDILINLFSSYPLSDGKYETRQSKIVMSYLKSWLLFDLFACLPFSLIEYYEGSSGSSNSASSYNDVLRLVRLPRLYRILRVSRVFKMIKSYKSGALFEKIEDALGFTAPKAKFLVFVITISTCVHVMACFWYFASKLQGFSPDTWVVKFGIMNKSDETKYLCAVYWAVTTLSTIGYGDITPQNDLERMLAIIWMIFGVGFFSYTVGSLSSLISQIDSRESILTQRLYMITEFAAETGINTELKTSLKNAIKYNSYKTGMSWADKMHLFEELPKNLRFKVALSMYHGAAQSICFFQDKDPSFAVYLMPFLKPHQINGEEVIYREGQYADEMFFLLKGRVNLVYGSVNIVYKSYLKGSYFGEIEIIEKTGRIDTVMTYGGCELLVLAKEVLMNLLEEHPKEGEELKRVAIERKKRHIEAKSKLLEIINKNLFRDNKLSLFSNIIR